MSVKFSESIKRWGREVYKKRRRFHVSSSRVGLDKKLWCWHTLKRVTVIKSKSLWAIPDFFSTFTVWQILAFKHLFFISIHQTAELQKKSVAHLIYGCELGCSLGESECVHFTSRVQRVNYKFTKLSGRENLWKFESNVVQINSVSFINWNCLYLPSNGES